jgi:hypothetical protein
MMYVGNTSKAGRFGCDFQELFGLVVNLRKCESSLIEITLGWQDSAWHSC